MKDKICCKVAEDLMELYNENLTSEETNNQFKTHLERCKSCKRKYKKLVKDKKINKENSNKIHKLKIESTKIILIAIIYLVIFSSMKISMLIDIGLFSTQLKFIILICLIEVCKIAIPIFIVVLNVISKKNISKNKRTIIRDTIIIFFILVSVTYFIETATIILQLT